MELEPGCVDDVEPEDPVPPGGLEEGTWVDVVAENACGVGLGDGWVWEANGGLVRPKELGRTVVVGAKVVGTVVVVVAKVVDVVVVGDAQVT